MTLTVARALTLMLGWIAMIVSILIAAIAAPWFGDNRPRVDFPLTPDSIPSPR